MFERICLVHYHEIGLKGRNRSIFEKKLLGNIKELFCDEPLGGIKRISGRLCVYLDKQVDFAQTEALARRITGVPGVARVSCGYRCERDIELLYKAAVQAVHDVGDFETFKVAARRNHTDFAINSMEMNQLIGAHLCETFPDKKVKMKNPDVQVCVEVVQNAAYVYALSIPGVGGLPVGTGGKVVCLLSSGFDSPVATWRMARRGAVCFGIHFSGRPQTSATSEYLVDDIAQVLQKTGCIKRVYVVPFGDYQREIASAVPPELRVIIYRRLMFRVAEALALREHALALVTGESLGQVASQTLENIRATDAAVELPVFRPLIGTDKQEIMNEAERLGTYELSSQDVPDCCTLFMPRNPETHARLASVIAAESSLPFDTWVQEILETIELHEY